MPEFVFATFGAPYNPCQRGVGDSPGEFWGVEETQGFCRPERMVSEERTRAALDRIESIGSSPTANEST